MKLRRILLVGLLAGCSLSLQAEPLALKDGHPGSYRVKKGDTLWDISAHFLRSPWLWPRLWQANPQVANPHLIYPGDILTLIWVDGQPRLVREQEAVNTVRLSPRVRVEPAIPTISFASIASFTDSQHMVAPSTLDGMPYVLGDEDGRNMMVPGRQLYVRGTLKEGELYAVYRPADLVLDKYSGEPLGQKAALVGTLTAVAQLDNQTAIADISSLKRDMRQGDKVLPLSSQESIAVFYYPRPGPNLAHSHVVTMGREDSTAGKNSVIFINKGRRDGIRSGDLYSILEPGSDVYDKGGAPSNAPVYSDAASLYQRLVAEPERLPAKAIGRLMVFKVYDKLSAALVLDSEDMIRIGYPIGQVTDAGPGS
ncbi:LysM peptidoglycan-binding domain-containing protein [Zobellella maritima]|uniref:LysM peptidoglycan-binding domain-containing protein n=1 Tax=Zobellella maritima TaxID=2059725 RepID=UPI0013004321|nr:LysM domain-containing protein [Zobellella maritima]